MSQHDRKALFEQAFARHFNEEERGLIRRNRAEMLAEWNAIKPELEKAMAAGDPASPAARAVAERCRAMNRKMLGDDGDLRQRFRAFRDDVVADPELAGVMSVTREMHAFIKEALAAAK